MTGTTQRNATLCTLALVCLLSACSQQPPAPKAQASTFSIKGSVREMNIPPEVVDFPEHGGKQEFMSYCAMCHTLKYISMQPNFPRKVWEAEVTKMIAKYKAPIDTPTSKKIAEYLVAIKSKD
jgi:sulfite dehydrogenase (cytochrome) subunit B